MKIDFISTTGKHYPLPVPIVPSNMVPLCRGTSTTGIHITRFPRQSKLLWVSHKIRPHCQESKATKEYWFSSEMVLLAVPYNHIGDSFCSLECAGNSPEVQGKTWKQTYPLYVSCRDLLADLFLFQLLSPYFSIKKCELEFD